MKMIRNRFKFVRGGAKMLTLALMLASGAANSGSYLVYKPEATNLKGALDSVSLSHFQTLRARALAQGGIRLDVAIQLPAGTEQDNTAAQMTARESAVISAVAAFQTRYGSNVVGIITHGILTPIISAQFSATGLDQLLADPLVPEFSEYGRYQGQLSALYQTLGVSQLPVGPTAGKAIAIIDSGILIRENSVAGPATGNEFKSRVVSGQCFSTPFDGAGVLNGLSLCQSQQVGFPLAQSGAPCTNNGTLTGDANLNRALANCGHGTHVAGIAAGNRANVASDSGLAPFAPIISIQTKSIGFNRQGLIDSDHKAIDVIKALDAIRVLSASGTPVAAVNMSLGYEAGDAIEPWAPQSCINYGGRLVNPQVGSLNNAIQSVLNQGIAVVAAAGNVYVAPGTPATFEGSYGLAHPACLPGVISVAATGKSHQTGTPYSVYGFDANNLADILAPGGDANSPTATGFILPAVNCANGSGLGPVCSASKELSGTVGRREQRSGTSMSAPVVTGLIQRLSTRFPQLSGVQAGQLLINSGIPTSVNSNTNLATPVFFTIPKVDIASALRVATLPQNITTSTATCGQINLSWAAPSIMVATEYRVRFASTAAGLEAATQTPTIQAATNFSISATQPQFFQVIAKDVTGDGVWSTLGSAVPNACTPAAISNLVADRIGTGPGNFCWAAVANATSYQMEDRPIGNAFTGQATVTAITELNNFGSLDWFDFPDVRAKVRACNSNGCGSWSAEAQLLDRNIMSLPPPDYISPCSAL